jgi:hypothetical protein
MKTKFREIHLSKKNLLKLDLVNSIIEEYAADGYKLTLRQLYYQLVSRDVIPNKQSEYAKLSKLLKEGRMAGVVNWEAIEDRLRVPYIPYYNEDPQEAIEDTINQYRLDRQKGQDVYIEVWVEKDALSGVLKRITSKYHIKLLVNRGYGSVTAIHDAYNRFRSQYFKGKNCKILYLGDHDPSGMDMIRDIDERINEMLEAQEIYNALSVEPIALTMNQIREHNPPPNPAKITDPRAKDYIKKYGQVSWEVDALNPRTLNQLLTENIEKNIDLEKYQSILDTEESDKKKLKQLSNKL